MAPYLPDRRFEVLATRESFESWCAVVGCCVKPESESSCLVRWIKNDDKTFISVVHSLLLKPHCFGNVLGFIFFCTVFPVCFELEWDCWSLGGRDICEWVSRSFDTVRVEQSDPICTRTPIYPIPFGGYNERLYFGSAIATRQHWFIELAR